VDWLQRVRNPRNFAPLQVFGDAPALSPIKVTNRGDQNHRGGFVGLTPRFRPRFRSGGSVSPFVALSGPPMMFGRPRRLKEKRYRTSRRSMTSHQPAAPITEIGTVFVPVSSQDRALRFYVDQLGFEKRSDLAYGDDHRWIEVAPRGSRVALALVPPKRRRDDSDQRGSMRAGDR
jgi:hypothetical protein